MRKKTAEVEEWVDPTGQSIEGERTLFRRGTMVFSHD